MALQLRSIDPIQINLGEHSDFVVDSFFDVFTELSSNTDTIVQRLDDLNTDVNRTVETEIVALQLRSIDPIQIALDQHVATFDSFFDVFTTRLDSLEGDVARLTDSIGSLQAQLSELIAVLGPDDDDGDDDDDDDDDD